MKVYVFILLIFCLLSVFFEIYIRNFGSYNEPYFDNVNKIIKRRKNTEGIYKTKYTNTGYFRINNEGWNSWRNYFEKKELCKCRIAIVGHSNVEGLRVPVDKIFSSILEKKLIENDKNAEIYTFGFGGMPLAQALHVSRYVLKKFHPDVLVIGTLIDNFLFENTDQKYFLSLKISPNGKIEEVLPLNVNQEDSPLSFLYFSKGLKYIDIKLGIGKKLNDISTKKTNISHENNQYLHQGDSIYRQQSILAVDYILHEFLVLEKRYGNKIIFIDFPYQISSYNEQPSQSINYIQLHNKEIIEKIKKYSFPIISLDNAFKQDYQKNGKKFDFPNDEHYNQHAHYVIGRCLADFFVDNNILSNTK